MLPLFIRLIRAEMLEVLSTDYIRFARAKGLSPNRIYFVHALKNTLLPVITVGGVQIGTLLAYTILTESVFQWPGMGFLFLEAVNRVDTPLIVAYLLVVGFIFVIVNTAVDIIYTLVNPVVRIGDGRMDMITNSPFWTAFLRRYRRDRTARTAAWLLLIFTLSALLAGLIAPFNPYDPLQIDVMDAETRQLGLMTAIRVFTWARTRKDAIYSAPFYTVCALPCSSVFLPCCCKPSLGLASD